MYAIGLSTIILESTIEVDKELLQQQRAAFFFSEDSNLTAVRRLWWCAQMLTAIYLSGATESRDFVSPESIEWSHVRGPIYRLKHENIASDWTLSLTKSTD